MKNNSLKACLLWTAALIILSGAAFAQSLPYRMEKKTLKEKQKTIKIEVTYPRMAQAGNPAVMKAFNSLMGGYISRNIAEFKAEHKKEYNPQTPPWNLFGSYETFYLSDRLISMNITLEKYSGGAHGMPEYFTLIYDLKINRKLELKDLFREDSSYLKAISDYCQKELMKLEDADVEWISKGAGPAADNFKLFYADRNGITFVFIPYQVAAYYQGSPKVTIPYGQLKKQLKENNPLQELY